MMKTWLMTLMVSMALILSGCVSITYDKTGTNEVLKVKTLFKSLDGLVAERDGKGFNIMIDKTYTKDPFRAVTELLEAYRELSAMGVTYDPDKLRPPDTD